MAEQAVKAVTPDIMHEVVFKGWMASDKEALETGLNVESFQPKAWEETDIDVKITHCGVCFSDICTLRSGWVRQPRGALLMSTHLTLHISGTYDIPMLRRP